MTPHPDQQPAAKPHESDQEAHARQTLAGLLHDSPVTAGELPDNLTLYLRHQAVSDLLALDALYRQILTVPGVIMEFGVRWGRHLAALTSLRAIHEPHNVHRRIIGFDTFTGFPDVQPIDQANRHAQPGGLAVSADYAEHLDRVLATHEAPQPLGHMRRTFCLIGDVRHSLPRYLKDNPQTVIALAYLDLDLYEPTRDTLNLITPHLTRGSVIAFDQIGHPKWPGETVAAREALGTNVRLRTLRGRSSPVYLRWT